MELHNSSISSKQSLELQQSELSSDTFDLLPLTPRRVANFENNNASNNTNSSNMMNNSKDKENFVIKVSEIDGDLHQPPRHSLDLNSNINNNNEQNKVPDPEPEGNDGNNQQQDNNHNNQDQQINNNPIVRPLNNLRPKRHKQHVKYHTLTGDGMESEKHEHHVIGYNTNSNNFQPPVAQQVKRIKTHQKSHSTGLEIKNNDNAQNNHNSGAIHESKTATRVKRHTKTRSDELHSV
jgi:hypothetical protein